MARDRANLRTDMWASAEWRKLSTGAQWLYMYLLTTPTLSYVGVADWRPARIAAKVADAGTDEIVSRCQELTRGRFAYVDDETEEVLIRSFLRHDGLLVNPNLWRSIGNAFADAASDRLRGVIAGEIQRLRDENPEGFLTSKGGSVNPWVSPHLSTALDTPPHTPVGTPSDTPSDTPSPEVAGRGSPTTTATATATSSKEDTRAKRERDREIETLFDEAYSVWPKKTERKKSLEKFKRLCATPHDAQELADRVKQFGKAYADTTDRQFVPALVVWLNGERWTDEIPGTATKPDPNAWMNRSSN